MNVGTNIEDLEIHAAKHILTVRQLFVNLILCEQSLAH